MRTNATREELFKALEIVNKRYNGNICFNRGPEHVDYNTHLNFTLKVQDSKKQGARRGRPDYETGKQRRLINACWHVHGHFFDALFSINPDLYIYSGKNKITKECGNWEDRNIGSMMQPMMYSEACECE